MMKLLKMKNNSGFTIIELMIVVAIISILLGIGIPNFRNMIGTAKLGAAARELRSNLQNAKSIAMKENKTVNITLNTTNYVIDGMTFRIQNGLTLTHNLIGTGTQINSRGYFVISTLPPDPQIKVSSSFGEKIVRISPGGAVSIL